MTDIVPLVPALLPDLDGFRVAIDAQHERGDIISTGRR
jgi:hypothetical protein